MLFFVDAQDQAELITLVLAEGWRLYPFLSTPETVRPFPGLDAALVWIRSGGCAGNTRLLLWHPEIHPQVAVHRVTIRRPSVARKLGVDAYDRLEFDGAVVLDLGEISGTHLQASALLADTEARAMRGNRGAGVDWKSLRERVSRVERAVRKRAVATLSGFGPVLPGAFKAIAGGLRTWDTSFAGQDKTVADLKPIKGRSVAAADEKKQNNLVPPQVGRERPV